jgi:hypothetical protein
MGGRKPGPLDGAANQLKAKQAVKQQYRQLILDAEQYGLPTRFLQYVSDHYSIEPARQLIAQIHGFPIYTSRGNSADIDNNELFLTSAIMDDVKSLDPRVIGPESKAIDTIYHESTHAFIDLMSERGDPKWRTIIKNGEAYYLDAPLETGGKAWRGKYAERLFHEAAAMYVGWRASRWWERYETLTYMALKIDRGETPYQQIPKILDFQRNIYNEKMAERTFGYMEHRVVQTNPPVKTTKKISDELKNFLDRELLEGKIPDDFDQVPGFQKLILGLGMEYSLR